MSSPSASPTASVNSSVVATPQPESVIEEELTDIQLNIRSRVQKIKARPDAHPFSQLMELQQAGIILSLTKDELGTVDMRSTVRVNASINQNTKITSTCESVSKKSAQKEAAANVLDKVVAFLYDCPPKTLFALAPQVRKQIGPTAKEIKEMEEDKVHLSVLQEIGASTSSSPDNKIGVLSIDLEQYERNLSIPLEVGVSFVKLSTGDDAAKSVSAHHLIVADHVDITNGIYVADHKWAFNFGLSQLVEQATLATTVTELLQKLCEGYKTIYLIGHTMQSDLKWLQEMGVDIPLGLVSCDIGRAYRGLVTKGDFVSMIGMQSMMDKIGVEYSHLHNGGNDAYYNIQVLLKLIQMINAKEQTECLVTT